MPVRRFRPLVGLILVSVCFGVSRLPAAQSAQDLIVQQTPRTPVFRGRTTVVPIDVRVLDKNGKPVTDLKAEDFTITENKVTQKVEYFSANALAAGNPEADAVVRPMNAPAAGLAPANRRLFLILLGRGRLQEPSKGMDATLRFVKERLLPQDQVAIMAWNRATDFSADKTKAVAVLERFRAKHEEIEHEISLYFTGLFGLYADQEVPPHIQKLVDEVFDSASGARQVLPTNQLQAAKQDVQRVVDNNLGSQLETFRLFSGRDTAMANGMFDPLLNMSFDDYIVLNRQTMQDVGNIYAGIDYLRFIDGEKHLIFVTEQGFYLPRADYDRDMAALASDARVALDTVQTGGVAATVATGPNGTYMTVANGFQLRALREISDISGGQSAVSKYAEQAFDRILSSTEFGYLIGYTSSDPNADSKMRDVKVTVNRKGVTVSHRRNYVARPDAGAYDPRESLGATRLMVASGYRGDILDLKFNMKLTDVKLGVQNYVEIELAIDASRLHMARAPGDRYVAALNFAVFAGDYYQKDIGQLWTSRDVFVPASRMEEVRRTGLPVTLKIPVKQRPVYLRLIVYDYGSDLLGSTTKVMK